MPSIRFYTPEISLCKTFNCTLQNLGLHKLQFVRLQTTATTMKDAGSDDQDDGDVSVDQALSSGRLPSVVSCKPFTVAMHISCDF